MAGNVLQKNNLWGFPVPFELKNKQFYVFKNDVRKKIETFQCL